MLKHLTVFVGAWAFVGSAVSSNDPGYEIFLGAQMTALAGSGVFLNPQRVLNAAGFAPAGNPISRMSSTNLAAMLLPNSRPIAASSGVAAVAGA